MAEVSRNLVAILLVLVIIVSAVGTWSLFGSKDRIEYSTGYGAEQSDASGMVALSVKNVPQDSAAVELEITRGGNNG
jgi:hypothetical protein